MTDNRESSTTMKAATEDRFGTLLIGVLVLVCSLGWVAVARAEQGKLKTYGYFDMEVEATFKKNDSEPWSFDQHHFNFISIYSINDQYRVFSEVEYEHGPSLSESESSGKIYLAKGFLEYKHSDALKLRVGKFLTPFGIYNERHDATPTFLPTALPHSVYGKHEFATGIKDRLFAKFATGIQVVGSLYPGDWETKYHLYVSNGRGGEPAGSDDNSNKGLGGRLVVSPPAIDLSLGASYYTDKHGLDSHTVQRSLGFDVEFDLKNLHLETELLSHWLETVDTISGIPDGRFRNMLGWYAMAAYTFADKVTPFLRYEYSDHDSNASSLSEKILALGINVALNSRVYLKNEMHFHDDHSAKNGLDHEHIIDRYFMYIGSVAVAF